MKCSHCDDRSDSKADFTHIVQPGSHFKSASSLWLCDACLDDYNAAKKANSQNANWQTFALIFGFFAVAILLKVVFDI